MSDALTDAVRSQEIGNSTNKLLDSETIFLTNPTRENLNAVYGACRELLSLKRGQSSLANKVSDYYKERFKRKGEFVIQSQDVVAYFNRMRGKERLPYLTLLITRAQDSTGKKVPDIWDKVVENERRIEDYLTISQKYQLEEGELTEEELERILRESKIIDIFPLPCFSD